MKYTVDQQGRTSGFFMPHNRPAGEFGSHLKPGHRVLLAPTQTGSPATEYGVIREVGTRIHTAGAGHANYVYVEIDAIDERRSLTE